MRCAAILLLACLAAAPATTRSARKPALDPAKAAVRDAMAELARELDAHVRNPSMSPLRASCNYFKDRPSDEVTPPAIVAALREPGTHAYVQWQLLSGLPDAPPNELVNDLLAVYRASPAPLPRPGMSAQEQRKLDQLIVGKTEEQVTDVKTELEALVNRVHQQNLPLVALRDELYRRLPKNPATFAAAIDDLAQRAVTDADAKDLVKALNDDVRKWTVVTPPSEAAVTYAPLAKALRRLADLKGPQYYDAPYWRESAHMLVWRKTRSGVDSGSKLKDLAVFLEEQAQQVQARKE